MPAASLQLEEMTVEVQAIDKVGRPPYLGEPTCRKTQWILISEEWQITTEVEVAFFALNLTEALIWARLSPSSNPNPNPSLAPNPKLNPELLFFSQLNSTQLNPQTLSPSSNISQDPHQTLIAYMLL